MPFFQKIKKTEALEQERTQLWNDFQTYKKVEKSDELKNYLAIKEKVESRPFVEKKREIESLKFNGSPEHKLIKQFGKLEKSKKLIKYFKVKDSVELSRFNEIAQSGKLEELTKLTKFVKNGEYKASLKTFKQKKKSDKSITDLWEDTEAYNSFKACDELRSSSDVVFYQRFAKSAAFKNYQNISGSTLLNQFDDIKKEINSEKFKERVAYLQDPKRYEKTGDFKMLSDFMKLNVDSEIQLYMKYNDTDAFKFFRDWKLTFQEDFYNIDKTVWSFVTPIALKGPGKNFSIAKQLQYYNNGDNFSVENNLFTLETKKEECQGLYWDEKFGFVNKTFNYVSGVAHTLNHFKQEYGQFEIKLKASKVKGVISSVSLVDEDEEICIRLFTANGNDEKGGLIHTDQHGYEFDGVNLKNSVKGYVIVSVNWSPEKIEWKINDKFMGRITDNIPHIPLGIRIETEVLKETSNLPHRLDIDWIRCYTINR